MTKKMAAKATKKTVADSNVENATSSFLNMWSEVAPGKFRPTLHRFEATDGKFELQIRKVKSKDMTMIDIYYNHKDGRKKFTIGASTKQLGKVWASVPQLIEVADSSEVETH